MLECSSLLLVSTWILDFGAAWQCELVILFAVTPGRAVARVLVLAEALLAQEETQLGEEEVMVSFQVMDLQMKWMANLKIRLTLQQGLMTLVVVPVPVLVQALALAPVQVQVRVRVWALVLVLAEVIGVLSSDCQNRLLMRELIASLSLVNPLLHAHVPNIP